MKKLLVVGDKLLVKRDGEVHNATIKKIGSSNGAWCMLTLDIHGSVGYCAAKYDEIDLTA